MRRGLEKTTFHGRTVQRTNTPAAWNGSAGGVLAVDVAVGDTVEEGQRLGVIEAMKMELALKAPHAGTVATVSAAVGDQVQLKQLLFLVEAADA